MIAVVFGVLLYLGFFFYFVGPVPLSLTSIIVPAILSGCISVLIVLLCFYMGTKQFRVDVGLLILTLASIASFYGGMSVTMDLSEYWHLIAILEANPHRYMEYMLNAFLYLILPPAVGLVYSIIAFVKDKKSPTGVLEQWLPPVVGCLFFFWGIYGLRWTYARYFDVMRSHMEIADLILKICLAVWVGFTL